MNCQTLRDAIPDIARGAPVGPGTAAAVDAHVQYCAACAAYLARERELSAGLRALAASTVADVSPEIEIRLQAAFAERRSTRSRTARMMRARSLQAAAAIVVIAASALIWWRSGVTPAKGDPPPAAAAPQPEVTFAEGFVPLPVAAGLPDFESGSIVRVEIPVASLPTYGIEIVPDARRTPVQADLLVGQDGQARAIRLVKSANVDRMVTP